MFQKVNFHNLKIVYKIINNMFQEYVLHNNFIIFLRRILYINCKALLINFIQTFSLLLLDLKYKKINDFNLLFYDKRIL